MGKTGSNILLYSLCVVLLFLCVCTFLPEVSLGQKTYISPIQLLQRADDLGLGIYGKYTITRPDDMTDEQYEDALAGTIETLRIRLKNYDMQDCDIAVTDNQLIIRAPFSLTRGLNDNAKRLTVESSSLLSILSGSVGKVAISIKTTTDSETTYTDIVSNAHIKDLNVSETGYEASPYGCYFNFTKEGEQILKDATRNASATNPVAIAIRVDDTDILANATEDFTLTSEYTPGMIGFSSTSDEDMRLIKIFATNPPMPLALSAVESYMIDGYLTDRLTMITVAVLLTIVAIVVVLCVMYGLFGLAYGIGLIVSVMFSVWTFTFIYGKFFSLAGLYGALIGIAIYTLVAVLLCEKNKQMSKNTDPDVYGRLKVISAKSRKQLLFVMLKIFGASLIMAVALWIFGGGALQSFGITLCYMTVISLLSILVIVRLFISLFINVTSSERPFRLENKTNEEVSK